MGLDAKRDGVAITDDDPRVALVEQLTLQGMMSDALEQAEAIAPLQCWSGARAESTAAWLLDHLGDSETATKWHVRSRKRYPEHALVRYFYGHVVLNQRGPVQGWLSIEDYEPTSASDEQRAEIFSLKARILACLGDERRAAAMLERCDPAALGAARFASTRASLLEYRQQRPEALEILLAAHTASPLDRILTSHLASTLVAENRTIEALNLLERVEPQLQTPTLTSQRAALENELRSFDAEWRSLDRLERLTLRAGRTARRSLAARRAENCYLRSDFSGAQHFGNQSESEYWKDFGPRLTGKPGPPDRKQLELPISLQEPMGCAPASLSLIANYFGASVDRIEVADQICYEGTASHSERGWVEGRGWLSREFTVDFEVACALIERGVPFLLVTVQIGSAHAQVVVGFDRTRRTLLTRDPSSTVVRELLVDHLLESHRAYGPRGHVLLPPERASLIDGIALPERELHDLAHAFRVALDAHDAKAAEARLLELELASPGHQLALWARRGLAIRDQDPYAIRACSLAILERFPDDANAELSVLQCLSSIGTEGEQRDRVQSKLDAGNAPWVFYERYAQLLSSNLGDHRGARRAALRALRVVPTRGRSLAAWAHIERALGNVSLARTLNRFAATLEPTDDDLARAHFEEAYGDGDHELAFQLVQDREQRYRERSSEPLRVMFGALEWLDRVPEAFAALDAGVARRPSDGLLLLYSAEAYARYGNTERATHLLAAAEAHAPREAVRHTAARLAELRGDLAGALELYREAHQQTPFALGLCEAIARLIGQLHGIRVAREFLGAASRSSPSHCGLLELYVRWLRGHDPAHVLPEIDALLALQPAHVWARRERALVLSNLGRHEDAISAARTAEMLAPNQSASQRVLAQTLAMAGKRVEAQAPARRAVQLWPDASGAIVELLRTASSLSEQLELVDWTWREIRTRSISGDALLEWHEYLHGLMPDQQVLERFEQLLAERPSQWVVHSLVGRLQLRTGNALGSRATLEGGLARFPYTPALALELAQTCRALGDREGELCAVESALRINPSWIPAVLQAADAHEHGADWGSARRVLERGLQLVPRSARLLMAQTELSWRLGEVERAFAEAKQAIEFHPENGDAWELALRIATRLKRTDELLSMARELVRERPWNAQIWLRLAELLSTRGETLASIEALEQALERNPDDGDSIDNLARALTRIGKMDEALAVCERKVSSYFGRGALRARRAWVLWEFGQRDDACLLMRKALSEHPDQIWGHRSLVEWETERKQHDAAVKLARSLVAQNPLDEINYGYLGAAERRAKNFDAAWQAFSTAARIDRGYSYAGVQRLEMALERRNLEYARQVLSEQGEHVPQHVARGWEIAIASAAGDTSAALEAVRKLASHPASPDQAFAPRSLELRALNRRQLRRGFKELVREPGLHRELGSLWIYSLDEQGQRPSPFRLLSLRGLNREAFLTAARSYFEILGEKRAARWQVLWALAWLGWSVRDDDEVWGKVGYALTTARAYLATQWWLRDYRSRRVIEAWMLHNYRVAALENRFRDAALRASEYALTLPADSTLQHQLAFVAFGRAANGDLEGARDIVLGRTADGLQLTDRSRWLFESAKLLVELESSEDPIDFEILRSRVLAHGRFLSLASVGTLTRWLAGGLLKQRFDLRVAAARWAHYWLLLATGALYLFAPNGAWWTFLAVTCFVMFRWLR